MSLVGIWTAILVIIFFFIMVLFWGSTNPTWIFARALSFGTLKILGIKTEHIGIENLPKVPSILIINHQSNLDPFIMGMMFPKDTIMIGKKEMLKVPLFGVMMQAVKSILIDRNDKKSMAKAMRDAVTAIKKFKKNIWIFPEGTRSLGKGLAEFKQGAFYMAIAAKAPITLIVNSPIEKVINVSKRKIYGGTQRISILPSISTEGLKFKDAATLQEKVERIFKKEYNRLTIMS